MLRGQRLHFTLDREQARQEIVQVRRERDQQLGLGLGRKRLRCRAGRVQPFVQGRVGFAEKGQERGIDASETLAGVEVFETEIEAEFCHWRAEDHSGRASERLGRAPTLRNRAWAERGPRNWDTVRPWSSPAAVRSWLQVLRSRPCPPC